MNNDSINNINDDVNDVETILALILQKLKPLSDDEKKRVLDAIKVFYSLEHTSYPVRREIAVTPTIISGSGTSYNERAEVSPKEFLREKAPKSDIEKVVCLAYFLTHYRGTNHFKTIDISKLNTEAAQLKFSNAAYAVDNASKRGFLVPAGKNGMKQISAMGEQFVNALPDREEAKAALELMKVRKKHNKKNKTSDNDSSDDSDTETEST